MGCLSGKMEEYIGENGLMENSMELVFSNKMQKIRKDMVSGLKVKDKNGLNHNKSNNLE